MDTENRTSRKRNAFATALLTTLAFALGFAEFVENRTTGIRQLLLCFPAMALF